MPQACTRWFLSHAPDDAPGMPRIMPHTCPSWCPRHTSMRSSVSYLISLKRLLFENIAHGGSFQHCTWLYPAVPGSAIQKARLARPSMPMGNWSTWEASSRYLVTTQETNWGFWKWVKEDENELNGKMWTKMDESGWKRLKWMKMDEGDKSRWKWMKLDEMDEVNECGRTWMKLDESGWK